MTGTLLSIILSFRWAFWNWRLLKVMRWMKDLTEFFGFGRHDACFFVSCSSRTRKISLEHFLNRSKPANFENREYVENAGNSVKMTVFDLQNIKTRSFFKMYLKFCTHIHLTSFFHIYSVKKKIGKIPQIFKEKLCCRLFFKIKKSKFLYLEMEVW